MDLMRCTAIVLMLVLAPLVGSAETWNIAPRTLAPPAAASDALATSIAATPAPEPPDPAVALPEAPAFWAGVRAERDGPRGEAMRAEAEVRGVEVTLTELAGVPVRRVRPARIAPALEDARFLHLHGGAYVFGGGDASAMEAVRIAAAAGIEVLSVDYRLAPEHPWPAAVDDAVAVYRALLETRAAHRIAIGGTSAGGGLTLSTVQRLREEGVAGPAALWLGTPWADLSDASDSLHTLRGIDRVLVSYDGPLALFARFYAGARPLTDPGPSPLYGDFRDFPPTQLVSGTRDMLLSDTVRTHRAIRAAGGAADLIVVEGFSHADYLMVPDAPESRAVFAELAAFLARHLD